LLWLIVGDTKKVYKCEACQKRYRYNDNITKYYTVIFVATWIIASIVLALFRKDYLHLKPLSLLQNVELFFSYLIVFVIIFCVFRAMSLIVLPDQYKLIEDQADIIPERSAAATVEVRKKRLRKG